MPKTLTYIALIAVCCTFAGSQNAGAASPETYTLTVLVQGVDQRGGNIGVLVFQNDKGWP